MNITLGQFLTGKALMYYSFSGEPVTATWSHYPIPHLIILDAGGRRLMSTLMPMWQAENFYIASTIDKAQQP